MLFADRKQLAAFGGMVGSLLFVVLSVPPALARKHPVQLEKNVDGAKCLECHEGKAKGTAVHAAVAAGCLSCHEVRVTKGVTRVKLTATTTSGLCFQCHDGMKPAVAKGRLHPPAVRDCTKCHDPHSSANKNQLLKPTSGDKAANLCLKCHSNGLNVPEKGSRHAALDMGCDTCHVTHKTGDPGKAEFAYHLTKVAPALCLDCHDPKDEGISKAHQNQPVGNANCLTCHDVHQSDRPKLAQKFVHEPFGEKSCDICHQAPKDGKVVLTQSKSRELCVSCHDETAKKIEAAKVQHAGAQEDCIQCHDPHAGKAPGFLRPDPVAVCIGCHSDQAELQKTKKVLHQPAYQQGCSICHQPHGGERPKLLRADINELCLSCHSTGSKPQKIDGKKLIAILGGSVRLPEDYLDKVPRFTLKFGMGHPTVSHPISDYTDPLDSKKVTKLNCLTCHQSHAGSAQSMLVTDQRPTLAFCRRCHEGMIGVK